MHYRAKSCVPRDSDIGLEFLPRRRSWPKGRFGEASPSGDDGGIVISSKAVWGPRAVQVRYGGDPAT
jgi:hypothetical protein